MTKILQWILFTAMTAPIICLYILGAGVALMMVVCTGGIALIVIIPTAVAAMWILRYLYFGIKYIILDHPTKEVLGLYAVLGVAIASYALLIPNPYGSNGSDYTPFYPWLLVSLVGGLYGTIAKHTLGQVSPAHAALQDYIGKATASGMKKPEIIQTLKANGWADSDITNAYKGM